MKIPKVTFQRSYLYGNTDQSAHIAGQEIPLQIERNKDIRSGLLGSYSVSYGSMGGETRHYCTQREAKAGVIAYVTAWAAHE